MHGPTCIFWANLATFLLKGTALDIVHRRVGRVSRAPAAASRLSVGRRRGWLQQARVHVSVRERVQLCSVSGGIRAGTGSTPQAQAQCVDARVAGKDWSPRCWPKLTRHRGQWCT